MEIIKRGRLRKSPCGEHECLACGTIFRLVAEDIATIPPGRRDPDGKLFYACPGCTQLIYINPFVAAHE